MENIHILPTDKPKQELPKSTQEKVGYVEPKEKAKAKLFRYSEEEVYIIVSDLLRKCQTGSIKDFRDVEDWFNKIKKK